MSLKLSLLGPVQLTRDGHPISVGGEMLVALLAYTAANGQASYPRHQLADLLWPDLDEVNARTNLRQLFLRLKRLPSLDRLFSADRSTIHFHGEWLELDLVQFDALLTQVDAHHPGMESICSHCADRLSIAVSLYRGDFISNLTGIEGFPFVEWATILRERLHARAILAMHRLAAYYEVNRRHGEAVELAQAILVLEPWDEVAHGRIIRNWVLSGQRSAALAQYDACVQILHDELGVEPGVELVNLIQIVRSGSAIAPALPYRNPYRGLSAFGQSDASLFFGREAFVANMVRAVNARPLVAVIGASGSGKSSVINAGLIPALHDGEFDHTVVCFRPGPTPLASLQDALALASLSSPADAQGRWLLVVDQFEEIYTLVSDDGQRRQFIDHLLDPVLTVNRADVRVVIAMRADFVSEAVAYRPLADAIQSGGLILGPMSWEERQAAILKPVQIQGVVFEPGLVERILDDAGDSENTLPLLQFTLSRLWENQRDGWITHAAYDAIGRVHGGLTQYAEEIFQHLHPSDQERVRRLFMALVNVQEGRRNTRRVTKRLELAQEMWPLVQQLAGERLLVTNRNPAGDETVELVHESLLSEWGRLRTWLEEDREFQLWQQRLGHSLTHWQTNQQDESAVLRGPLLAEAESWLARRGTDMQSALKAYIQAGVGVRQRIEDDLAAQRRREHARLLTVKAQLALVNNDPSAALVLALSAARIPEAPEEIRPILAEAAYAPGTRQLLDLSKLKTRSLGTQPDWVFDVALNQEGTLAAVVGADGGVVVWDLNADGAAARVFDDKTVFQAVCFGRSSGEILAGATSGDVFAWSLVTGKITHRWSGQVGAILDMAVEPGSGDILCACESGDILRISGGEGGVLQRWPAHGGRATSLAIHADGRTALSGGEDRSMIWWDLETGRKIRTFAGVASIFENVGTWLGHHGGIRAVAFGPSSNQALSAGDDEYVLVWDLRTGDVTSTMRTPGSGIYGMVLHPSRPLALVGGLDSRLYFLDLARGKALRILSGHTKRITALTLSADGERILTGAADGTVREWDLHHGALVRSFPQLPGGAGLGIGLPLPPAPEPAWGAVAGWDGRITLFDLHSGAPVNSWPAHADMVFAGVKFYTGHQGQICLASASGDVFGQSKDTSVGLWSVPDGHALARFEGHTDRVWELALHPDGRWIATGAQDGALRLWPLPGNPEPDRVLYVNAPQGVRCLAYSPDGRTLLAGAARGASLAPNYDLLLLDAESGAEVQRFPGHTETVTCVLFSQDGRRAFSGSYDKSVGVWDVGRGELLMRFAWAQMNSVSALALSPDERLLAAGDIRGNVVLWDLATGVPLRRIGEATTTVQGLCFAKNGRTLLVIYEEEGVWEWRVDATRDDLLAWIRANRMVEDRGAAFA